MDTLLRQLADDLTELGDNATAGLPRQAIGRFMAWKFEAGERLLERALEERHKHEPPHILQHVRPGDHMIERSMDILRLFGVGIAALAFTGLTVVTVFFGVVLLVPRPCSSSLEYALCEGSTTDYAASIAAGGVLAAFGCLLGLTGFLLWRSVFRRIRGGQQSL
jgi:hypothetical protein